MVAIGIGGLGTSGIQVLRALSSARIIAVDRSPMARELAGELAADEVVGSESPVEEVLRLTGGEGADAVVDFVGEGDTPKEAIACCGKVAHTSLLAMAERSPC